MCQQLVVLSQRRRSTNGGRNIQRTLAFNAPKQASQGERLRPNLLKLPPFLYGFRGPTSTSKPADGTPRLARLRSHDGRCQYRVWRGLLQIAPYVWICLEPKRSDISHQVFLCIRSMKLRRSSGQFAPIHTFERFLNNPATIPCQRRSNSKPTPSLGAPLSFSSAIPALRIRRN